MADVNANIGINIDSSSAIAELKSLQRQISQFHTSIAKSSAAAATAQASLQKNFLNSVNSLGAFSAQMVNVKTSSQAFTDSLEKNKFSMREYFRYATASTKTFGKTFRTEYDTIGRVAEERVKKLQTQYIKMGQSTNGIMQAMAITPKNLDMSSISTQTALAAQKQQLFNQLLKQGSTNLLNFGKNTQWAGRQLMVGFTLPLAAFGATAVKAFNQMETATIAFKKVYGDLGTSPEESAQALADIQALAKGFTQYGVAASTTVDLASKAAAAGFKGLDLQAQTTQATRLSVLGQIEQQQALETTIALQNAFAISSADLGSTIDFLNAVENQTVVSLDDITTAIPKVAPVIQQLGGNVKDLAFFLTAMKEGGVNASEGANALKSGLASLINPSTKAKGLFKDLGINIDGIVNKNKGDLKKTVLDFAAALDTLDPLTRARAIETMFGKFQFARLSTLFQNISKDGSQASRVLDLSNASVGDLANTANKELGITASSAMNRFKKAVEDLKITLIPIGKAFLEAATPIVKFVSDILEKFSHLSDGTKKAITIMVAVIGGLGPILLMTFGLLANGLANIMKLFATLRGGYAKLTGQSQILGEQTQYMTSEQIDAAAAAHSLDQVHAKLTQQFTAEATAVYELRNAYAAAMRAATKFSAVNPGMMVPGRTKKFAGGGVVSGPGTGTSDSVPIMASTGEAVIPADSVKKNPGLVAALISGNIPRFAKGTLSVGGTNVPMNFKSNDAFTKIQAIIAQVMTGASGLKNAEEAVAETLMRLSNDSNISLKSFKRELDVVTKSLEGVLVPSKMLGADRKQSASGAGISGTVGQNVIAARGDLGAQEVERARIAAEAVTKEYTKLAGTNENLGITSQVLSQSTELQRAHVIEVNQTMKNFGEAWDANAYLVQTRAENELSQLLTNQENQKLYLSKLKLVDATEVQKAEIQRKISKDLALTEQELQVQAKVLKLMLQDTTAMASTTPAFKRNAIGTLVAANSRAQQGPAAAGVGSRTSAELMRAESNAIRAQYRGQMQFVKQLEVDGTASMQRLMVALERKAETASASKRTRRLGRNIIEGAVLGMRDGEAALQAEAVRVADIATMSKTSLYGTGPVTAVQKSMRRQQQKLSMSDTGAMAIGSTTRSAAEGQQRSYAASADKLNKFNGALMGGMFALSSLSGMASMAGGSLGKFAGIVFQISGPLLAVSSILQMFTGEKMISLLSKFRFAFGWGTAALIAGTIAIKLINSAREKERLAIEGVGKAANLTTEQIAKLGDLFGFTPQKSNLEIAKPTVPGLNPTQRTKLDETKTLLETDKAFQNQVKTLKTASDKQIDIIFKSIAIRLKGQGATTEAIQTYINALKEVAGKTDVKFDLKSIDLTTKEGQAGLQASVDSLVKDYKAAFAKGYSTTSVQSPVDGQIYKIENATKSLKTSLSTTSNVLSSTFMALDTQLKNGTINAGQFTQSFDGIGKSIEKMPKADALFLMNAVLKTMPSELAQSAAGIKNAADQMLILKAAALGVAVSAAMINQLTVAATSKDGGAARAASRVRNHLNQEVKAATDAAAEIAKAFKDAVDGTITGGTGEKSPYQIGLEQLRQQRKEIGQSATAYKRLVNSGIDGAKAFELSKDAVIAAALATAKNGKEWNTILALVKSVNKELASQAVGDYFKKLKGDNELQKQFNAIVPTLEKMGMSAEDIASILGDPNLMQGFIDGINEGKTAAERLQWIINRLAEKKTLELEFKLKTTEGQAQVFTEGYNAAMGYFDAQSALIEQQRTGSQEYKNINAEIEAQTQAVNAAQDAINSHQSSIEGYQRDLETNLRYGQGVLDNLNSQIDAINRVIDINFDKPLQALANESDILSNNLTLIDKQQAAINATYDAQIAALTEVSTINTEIANQQRDQLGLATALTSGDISAAASAAQTMRANNAQAANDRAQKAVEASRQNALNGVTAGGMTRTQIEERQFQISQQQFALTEQRKVKEAEIAAIQEKIYAVEQLRAPILKAIAEQEQVIANIKFTQLDPSQKLLDAAIKTKDAYDKQTKAMQDGVLDATGKTKDQWIKINTELEAAKTKTDQYSSKLTTASGIAAALLTSILALNTTVTTTHTIVTNYETTGTPPTDTTTTTPPPGSTGTGLGAGNGGGQVPIGGYGPGAYDRRMYGGLIKKMAFGGVVSGVGNVDSVPSLLMPGEFVVNKRAASAYGPLLQSINESQYPGMGGLGGKQVKMVRNSVNASSNSTHMYNYNLGINVNGSNMNPQQLAGAVITEIKRVDAQRIRGQKQ
jgi:TP901 family phage tail tape measure protein